MRHYFMYFINMANCNGMSLISFSFNYKSENIPSLLESNHYVLKKHIEMLIFEYGRRKKKIQ